MKISKLFHWLYASVMMLPLVVAPVYAIFMHRHQVTNYEVTTGGYEITEKYQTNEVNDLSDLVEGNVYHFDYLYINSDTALSDKEFEINFYNIGDTNFDTYDGQGELSENWISYYDSLDHNYIYLYYYQDGDANEMLFRCSNDNGYASVLYTLTDGSYIIFEDVDFSISGGLSDFVDYVNYYKTHKLHNSLEYMVNPTASTFQSYSYEYNNGLTYNDTDIGSQFVYSIYLPLNKYFNVTNFLGLNNLYGWINTNVFSGTAPLGFNIFYMLLSYWLLVSIFWLVFDVVMYVPNLAHRWLDKGSLQ